MLLRQLLHLCKIVFPLLSSCIFKFLIRPLLPSIFVHLYAEPRFAVSGVVWRWSRSLTDSAKEIHISLLRRDKVRTT